MVNEKPTQKDKRLPMDLFLPADFVCLRCAFSFRPVSISTKTGQSLAL
jgi:hypothetical protein